MGSDQTAARELGLFLRSRRERTTPQDLGLEPGPRRRVGGLRREEVAALAELSTDYYKRLEHGRNVRPSESVIDAIADALDLDPVERRHVQRLAGLTRRPLRRLSRTPELVPRNAGVLLESIDLPAFVVTRHLDVLAFNDLAAALLGDTRGLPRDQRNVLAALFRDEGFRQRCPDWEAMALDFIGILRAAVATDPTHPRAVAVVGELSIRSAEFRRLWARHDVRESIHGTKVIRHPVAGDIALEWDAYPLPGEAGPLMIVMTPRPGQEEQLALLRAAATA
ncbi:transcriptional regulator [Actinoplanes sp. NBRC 14428]|uniref:Helix-turn-helix protein n=1 Tax=Pseudosporangium ferrugineum TaxID=439699 RepID=A0A2T0SBC4_9ACTN|nr:helix-turn-helix transcriptional regulator [Pseudosporangium ferrugineum]PRY30727.1 helix-turn-helix protein [Pseudosporangium ferrugineum]BCJ50280.1 transcriptional regulator [Actinoplanes sp. NBRC 14428]